jgi:hypothetical protein
MENNHNNNTVRKEENVLPREEAENLGLDADQSSGDSPFAHLNNDNDRISHNRDGEDDDHDTKEMPGNSPLMDK